MVQLMVNATLRALLIGGAVSMPLASGAAQTPPAAAKPPPAAATGGKAEHHAAAHGWSAFF